MENSDNNLVSITIDPIGLDIMKRAALTALQVDGSNDFAGMYEQLLRIEKEFFTEDSEDDTQL